MIEIICMFLDWAIPRFISEDVALIDEGDGYGVLCAMHNIRDGDYYDAIATARSFDFFGHGYFAKFVNIMDANCGR